MVVQLIVPACLAQSASSQSVLSVHSVTQEVPFTHLQQRRIQLHAAVAFCVELRLSVDGNFLFFLFFFMTN